MKYQVHIRSLLAVLMMLSGFFSVNAQQTTPANTLILNGKEFSFRGDVTYWIDSVNTHGVPGTVFQSVLQFNRLVPATDQEQLGDKGVRFVNYVASNAYLCLLTVPIQRQQLPVITGLLPVPPEIKVDTRLHNQNAQSNDVVVTWISSATSTQRREALADAKATIIPAQVLPTDMVYVRIARSYLTTLASSPWVAFIGPIARDITLNMDERAASGAAAIQGNLANGGFGLTGQGVTIGVGDNASAILHGDLKDRVVNFNPAPPAYHGVHTSGTAASAGIVDPAATGMAPQAMLVTHLYNLVWLDAPNMRSGYNMTLTNNSYASVVGDCAFAGTYDQYAAALDDMARTYKDILHVFAAGNDGAKTCGSYPTGYGTVVGSYQAGKNVLVVGSLRKDLTQHVVASRGPVRDGRLKPELVTFGHGIYSCSVFDAYGLSNGTSMAAPGVTGGLALLSERYKQSNSGNAPAALLKALVINGATDIGIPGPDYAYGYGMMNLLRSIQMLDDNRYVQDSVVDGQNKSVTLSVPANTAQLKVLLYWPDAPASPLAAKALVNNLDLKVETPGGQMRFPLILDTIPGNVTNPAAEGIDNLNNVEQVVIDNPQAGLYTVTISGTSIPVGRQPFVLVYDILPEGVRLHNPVADDPVKAGDSLRVYWEASPGATPFTLQWSQDNGASWIVIDNNISADKRMYYWDVPGINAAFCKLRISRNGTNQVSDSPPFSVSEQPALQLATDQCPGYIAVNWNALTGISSYEILVKKGATMQPVDTVANTSYVFRGLHTQQTYYVAVRPLFPNGSPGYRSLAVSRKPDGGNCTGTISDNDLMIAEIVSPKSARQNTSSQLTNAEPLILLVRSLDDQGSYSFKIHYQVNNNSWQTYQVPVPVGPGSGITFNAGLLDLSQTGSYQLTVVVENTATSDPVAANDTVRTVVKNMENLPIDLNAGFFDGFEQDSIVLKRDDMGISSNGHWDYYNSTDSGRLRSFVSPDITITGNRSWSMDLDLNHLPGNQNNLIGTFNLAAYDASTDEVRLEFSYKIHGQPKLQRGNQVSVRSEDTAIWMPLFTIDSASVPGQVYRTGSLSLSHLLENSGRNFSSSFGVCIGQYDTSCIAINEYGNGMTLDDFRMYTVNNDVQLLSVLNPKSGNCGLTESELLTIRIYNSDNLPQQNVQVFYRVDNGPIVSETIPIIAAKDTIDFTFTQPINMAVMKRYLLDVFVHTTGDSYLANDSMLNLEIRNQPLINTYPYLENFETGEQGWFSSGIRSSWQLGTPASSKIIQAASGIAAWKTNLTGSYNDNEHSALYSPCFDLTGMIRPTLSFSIAMDIENCGATICDAAWVEWSTDGKVWQKLGTARDGFNWYDTLSIWRNENDTRWKVATISLPVATSPVRLRFVFHSDAGASRDGLAIDDIHVYDLNYPVYTGTSVSSLPASGNAGNYPVISDSQIFASVLYSDSQPRISISRNNRVVHPGIDHRFLPAAFVITGTDSSVIQTYITDDDVVQMLQTAPCARCPMVSDVYRLGILKYQATNGQPNFSVLDNDRQYYSFRNASQIAWIPYDKGYYTTSALRGTTEIWFTTGIPETNFSTFLIYPNPVTDGQLHIQWVAPPGQPLVVELLDVVGKEVFSATLTTGAWDNQYTLQLPALATGLYLLRYRTANEHREVKLVIQNR